MNKLGIFYANQILYVCVLIHIRIKVEVGMMDSSFIVALIC